MKANLIILVLLLAAVAGSVTVIILQLSTPTFSGEDLSGEENGREPAVAPDEGNGGEEAGETSREETDTGDGPSESGDGGEPDDGGGEQGDEPENGLNNDRPREETPLDRLLRRFHEHQTGVKWMRGEMTMTRFGIYEQPVETDDEKRETGRTSSGGFIYKPDNRFALRLEHVSHDENSKKESEQYLAYMHVLWIVKRSGDTVKAERWLIENDKMYEVLLLLQGADPDALNRTFDMRLIDKDDASERKRLKREGHDVEDLKKRDVYLLELIYKDKTKRRNYKHLEAVISRDFLVEKLKLYNAFNDAETIIWFENVEINKGEEIHEGEFRFKPSKEGIKKFSDNATLERAADILWRMRRTGSWVRGVRADYEDDRYDPAWGEETAHSRSSGVLYFMPPDKFRIEIAKPKEKVLGSNGKKAYSYEKENKRATIFDVEKAQGKVDLGNLRIMQKFFAQDIHTLAKDFNFKFEGVEKIDGLETYRFELKPRGKAEEDEDGEVYNVDRIELWVELETFLACKIRLYDLQRKKNYNEVGLKNIDISEEIPAEKFDPVFPEDVEVIEE